MVSINSGAIPALRGYRKQFLYTLGRIISAHDKIFSPEKIEDCSVYDEQGRLIEIIQVKDHSGTLSFSDLKSFLERATKEIGRNSDISVTLATYGPLGKELADILEKKEIGANSKFSQVRKAIQRLQVKKLDEAIEHQRIMSSLSEQPMISGDVQSAFDILMQSLYVGSELGHSFTRSGIQEHIQHIGKYLVGREAHHSEWGTSILPLANSGSTYPNTLREEFSQGVGARWEHIDAGIDMERPEYLTRIHDEFTKHNITIIHGASGQGKSSLAYRYLNNFCPTTMRYELRDISTRERALEIAAALRSYGTDLPAPITFYADISHADKGIEELINRVAGMPHIRLLLTIREEDWRLISLSKADVSFSEIMLEFSEPEARQIFDSIENNFPDFSQAWAKFEGGGPLLEFMYLLNHTETLNDRLSKQYNQIADGNHPDDLKVLESVAIAGSCGARIDLRKLKESFPATPLKQTIGRLESEYLVREDGEGIWLSGLHPIRSTILANLCTDAIIKPWEEVTLTCMPLLLDDDFEVFLLHAFLSHPETEKTIIKYIRNTQPYSWNAAGGIARALLWKGVHDYIQNNQELINEMRSVVGDAALYLLDFDLVEMLDGEKPWEDFASILPEEGQEQTKNWRNRQRPKTEVFTELNGWLREASLPTRQCDSEGDWHAMGEVAYWASANKQADRLFDTLNWAVATKAVEALSLQTLGTLIYGLWNAFSDRVEFQQWYKTIRPKLISRYRIETLSPRIEIKDSLIRAHFIVPVENNEEEQSSESKKINLHQQGIEHTKLLALLFPDSNQYGCQGYGHMLLDFLEYDETTKTGIYATYLRPDWVMQINKTARILSDFESRPRTWRNYCSQMMEVRQSAIQCLDSLRLELSKHFRSKKVVQGLSSLSNSQLWQEASKRITHTPSFPIEALDPWGFSEERSDNANDGNLSPQQSNNSIKSAAHLHQYADFLKMKSAYSKGLSNFINQAPPFLAANSYMGKAKSEEEKNGIEGTLNSLGIDLNNPFLPIHNLFDALQALPRFQQLYRMHFARLSEPTSLEKIEREERDTLISTWCLWHFFVTSPSSRWNTPKTAAINRFEQEAKSVRKAIENELSHASSCEITIQCLPGFPQYKDEPALWITVDAENPIDVFGQYEEIYNRLLIALGEIELHSLKYYAVRFSFSHVIIVPLIAGKMLKSWAWVLPSFKFTSNDESNRALSQLDLILQPIDDKITAQTGLELWRSPQIATAMSLFENVATIKSQLMHMIQIAQTPDLDEEGRGVIRSYFSNHQQNTSKHLQQVFDAEKRLDHQYCETPSKHSCDHSRKYLDEAFALLSNVYDELIPPGLSDGKTELTVDSMKMWEKQLESVLGQVFMASWLWATYFIHLNKNDPINCC